MAGPGRAPPGAGLFREPLAAHLQHHIPPNPSQHTHLDTRTFGARTARRAQGVCPALSWFLTPQPRLLPPLRLPYTPPPPPPPSRLPFALAPHPSAGFQTHTTPVLLGVGERAELGSDQYVPLSPILEGQVILRKNPGYVAMDE